MKYRYLTEDVPYLLVPVFGIGKTGVHARDGKHHPARSVIAGEDYLKTGRVLEGDRSSLVVLNEVKDLVPVVILHSK